MTLYIGREASKLWKRFCAEIAIEIDLIAVNWKYILGGIIFQISLYLAYKFVQTVSACFPEMTCKKHPWAGSLRSSLFTSARASTSGCWLLFSSGAWSRQSLC